jgi:hypothetical protein
VRTSSQQHFFHVCEHYLGEMVRRFYSVLMLARIIFLSRTPDYVLIPVQFGRGVPSVVFLGATWNNCFLKIVLET